MSPQNGCNFARKHRRWPFEILLGIRIRKWDKENVEYFNLLEIRTIVTQKSQKIHFSNTWIFQHPENSNTRFWISRTNYFDKDTKPTAFVISLLTTYSWVIVQICEKHFRIIFLNLIVWCFYIPSGLSSG